MSYSKRANLDQVDWESVASYISSGHSYTDAAGEFGLTVHYIKRGLSRLELDVHPLGEDHVSYVYIIGPVGGPYKVGKADDPDQRLTMLQSGNPYPLKVHLRYSVPAHRVHDLEAAVHERLKADRLLGEWYRCDLRSVVCAFIECDEPDLFAVSESGMFDG